MKNISTLILVTLMMTGNVGRAAPPPKYTKITCDFSRGPDEKFGTPVTYPLDSVGGFTEFDMIYHEGTEHIVVLGGLIHFSSEGGVQQGWSMLFPDGIGITCQELP